MNLHCNARLWDAVKDKPELQDKINTVNNAMQDLIDFIKSVGTGIPECETVTVELNECFLICYEWQGDDDGKSKPISEK